jgi:hypothetical protein
MSEQAAPRRAPSLPRQAEASDQPRRRAHRLVVVLGGGLGDQLFQWAFAETLRGRTTRLVADATRCRPLQIEPLLDGWSRLHRVDLGRRVWPGYVVERRPGYDEDLLVRARTGRYLVGAFRSLRYFGAEQDRVRSTVLGFAEDGLTGDGRAVLRYLRQADDVVAVHVERDGRLPGSYYRQAFTGLAGQGFRRRLWVSDDPPWVARTLAAPDDLLLEDSLVSTQAGRIGLMSACRGRVLSTSTSAWWAGFLGRQPGEDGAVVAPARWFVQERLSPADLLAPGWQLR